MLGIFYWYTKTEKNMVHALVLCFIFLFISLPTAKAATCYGDENCTACSSCRYCRNCNSGGKPCGVYNRTLGISKKRTYSSPKSNYYKSTVQLKQNSLPAIKQQPRKPSEVEKAYVERVRARVQESWNTYSPHNKVTAKLSFEINQNGQPENIKVINAVGNQQEIENAREAIKYATPFGKPPIKKGPVSIQINFRDSTLYTNSGTSDSEVALENRKEEPPLAPPINQQVSPGYYNLDSYRHYGSSGASSGGSVHVKGYFRKDGTYVRPHTRKRRSH